MRAYRQLYVAERLLRVVVELHHTVSGIHTAHKFRREELHQVVFRPRTTKSSSTPERCSKIRDVVTRFCSAITVNVNDAIISGVRVEIVQQDHSVPR